MLRQNWPQVSGLAVNPLIWVVAAVLAAVGSAAAIGYYLAQGRDRRYAGQIPGLVPRPGEDAREIDQARVRAADLAVRFTPPDNLSPGLAHTLGAEYCDVQDYLGTVLFLADQGYLTLSGNPLVDGPWSASYARDPAGLSMFDRACVELAVKDPLLQNPADLTTLRQAAYFDLRGRGLFRQSPWIVRLMAGVVALVVTLIGVTFVFTFADFGAGAIGLAFVVTGLVMLVLSRRMPARTAAGRAAQIQALDFLLYLRTAEQQQLAHDIAAGLRSPLVPWGVAFGLGRLPGGLSTSRGRQAAGIAGILLTGRAAAGPQPAAYDARQPGPAVPSAQQPRGPSRT